MSDLVQLLFKYGYIVVFGISFLEQLGFPLPAPTLIIGMGALSRSGQAVAALVVATASLAALAGDLIWYELGRSHGRSVLRLLCRISLEPDYCVRRTEDAFERLGLWTLLPGKFIPGINAAAVPLAGMMKTPLLRFLIFDIPAVILWGGTYTLLGYAFSVEIERIILYLSRFGLSVLLLAAAAITFYVVYKIEQRRRFLNTLSISRITPKELKAKMDAHESVLIFDIRNRLDRDTEPVRIPGAFHVLPEHIEFQREDIPRNQQIVVYCNCPNEATSARVAMQLRRRGLRFARPLKGGLDGWRELNLPLELLD
jgi:membrane protein DedA with SNARE-associated domain/rhodanese-related sulfurtransferase